MIARKQASFPDMIGEHFTKNPEKADESFTKHEAKITAAIEAIKAEEAAA